MFGKFLRERAVSSHELADIAVVGGVLHHQDPGGGVRHVSVQLNCKDCYLCGEIRVINPEKVAF